MGCGESSASYEYFTSEGRLYSNAVTTFSITLLERRCRQRAASQWCAALPTRCLPTLTTNPACHPCLPTPCLPTPCLPTPCRPWVGRLLYRARLPLPGADLDPVRPNTARRRTVRVLGTFGRVGARVRASVAAQHRLRRRRRKFRRRQICVRGRRRLRLFKLGL